MTENITETTKSDKLTNILEKYKELSKECDMILYKIKINKKEAHDHESR